MDERIKLKRSCSSDSYYYLSSENSKRYDQFKDSNHWKDKIIIDLILQLAEKSRGAHASSKY